MVVAVVPDARVIVDADDANVGFIVAVVMEADTGDVDESAIDVAIVGDFNSVDDMT